MKLRLGVTRAARQISLIVFLLFLVSAPAGVRAQSWGGVETALSLSGGSYQVGSRSESASEGGWATSAALRQTLATFFFVEAEASLNRTSVHLLCPFPVGGDPNACPDVAVRFSYVTVGFGLQFPVGPVRPFAGIGVGQMARTDHPSADSNSRFLGLSARASQRLGAQIEYRQRRDDYFGSGADRVRNDQWLFGVSLRVF